MSQEVAVNALGTLALAASSFVIGWIASDKLSMSRSTGDTDAYIQDMRFKINHLMAILTLTVKGGLRWETLPGGVHRARATREALVDTANNGPTFNSTPMACQDRMGSEFVLDLYPDEQSRRETME